MCVTPLHTYPSCPSRSPSSLHILSLALSGLPLPKNIMAVVHTLSRAESESKVSEDSDSVDVENGQEKLDALPRTDTVRFGNKGEEAANRKVFASAGIGLPRTLTLERPRYEQKNKVIGDFRTLSVQLSQGGLASPDGKRAKRGDKKKLRGDYPSYSIRTEYFSLFESLASFLQISLIWTGTS